MPTTKLLETLLHIERSVGRAENATLRNLLMDAQNQLLLLQKESIQLLEQVQQLRERREPPLAPGSWRAVAATLAKWEGEKETARLVGPVAVVERAS
jgi:hypothetical protein